MALTLKHTQKTLLQSCLVSNQGPRLSSNTAAIPQIFLKVDKSQNTKIGEIIKASSIIKFQIPKSQNMIKCSTNELGSVTTD